MSSSSTAVRVGPGTRRVAIWLAAIVGAVLLLWLLAWLAVPPLAKWQGEKQLSALLGRPVGIGAVRFTPWDLDLVATDITVGAAPDTVPEPARPASAASTTGSVAPSMPASSGASTPSVGPAAASASAPPQFAIGRLHLDIAASSLVRLAPVVQALEIDALRVRVARTAAGHYDIDDVIRRLTPDPNAPPTKLAKFALYNLQLRDGEMRFDDRPAGRVHELKALHLALPFLSNLPAQVDVKVLPRLSFVLNGAPFDSGAVATPFAQTRAGELTLKVDDLDLAPYLGYLPDSLPVRLAAGRLSTQLGLRFALPPTGPATLLLHGTASAKDVVVHDAAGADLLGWRAFDVGLRDGQPFARRLAFDSLRLDGVELAVRRDADGRINLTTLGGAAPADRSTAPRPAASASAAASASVSADGTSPPWQIEVARLDLTDSRVRWNDAAVHPAAALQLDGLAIGATGIRWPNLASLPLHASGTLRGAAPGSAAVGRLQIDGSASDRGAQLGLRLDAVSLAAFGPYLAQALVPRVDGSVSAEARVDWAAAPAASGASPAHLRIAIAKGSVDALALHDGADRAAPAAALPQLTLADLRIDVPGRAVTLGRLRLERPSLEVERDRAGRLNLAQWALPATGGAASAPAPAGAAAAPWRVQIDDASLDGGQLRFVDASVGSIGDPPVRLDLSGLHLATQHFVWQGDRPTAPAPLQLSTKVGAPADPHNPRSQATGSVDWKGHLGAVPFAATGNLKVERFPAHLLMPYLPNDLALSLVRAEVGYTGSLAVKQRTAGVDVDAAADVLLGAVKVDELLRTKGARGATDGGELLSWNALGLRNMHFVMREGARPRLDIAEAGLSDFYARLVVTEEGRLNLSTVAGAPAAAASGAAPTTVASAPAQASARAGAAASTPASAAVAARPASSAGLPLDVRVGGTTLTNGRMDFSDHFVRPNYSAGLTELNGRIGALSSETHAMADIALKGKAAGTALLDISGRINPFADPLALDIHAKATDLELAPLSTYAAKYAGYAIQRGRLSMDVAYKIEPDGRLQATNQLILNQLTFGDKVESPEATKLPVRLAVALLKDRNGVIDLDLPVSGSLNDPQFSIAGLIGKLLLNVLTKALTSPFALLTGGLGGGGDGGIVGFTPGTAEPTAPGSAAIDKVAKALADRPGLLLTVTGTADRAAEDAAYRQAAIAARLQAARRREQLAAGAPAVPASGPPPVLSDDVRTRLLKQVYQDTDIPTKPKNALGFAKDVPAAEMEALLDATVPVDDDAMRDLATRRGLAVRDALIAKGLPSDRLFLAAPELKTAPATPAAPWTPQVTLALTAR